MLMAWVIASMCSSSQTLDQNACNHFLEASTKQVEIYQYADKTEDYLRLTAKNAADDYLGKDSEKVVGGTVFVYKVYRNKAVDFRVPNMGMCDTINSHVGQDDVGLTFNWRF